MRKIILFIILALFCGQLLSQLIETASLKNFLFWEEPNSTYDRWISHVSEGIASANYNLYAPYDRQTNGFGDFRIPTALDMQNWGYITEAFLMQDMALTQDLIDMYQYPYQALQFNDTDTGRTLFMLRELPNMEYYDDNGTPETYDDEHGAFDFGWGLFIYNPSGNRPIIITVPHPNDDYPSPAIGYETFKLWNAKFLLINGAGREVKWNNVPPFYNSKSLSDPTRVSNHPFNKSYQMFCDLIRGEFGMREFSAQIHTYDWNRHVGYASVQISAGNARQCINLPTRDLSNLKLDLINQGNHLMIPANTHGTHQDVYLNDFYAVYNNVHDFIFEEGDLSYPVNNSISLPGAEGNQQQVYTLAGWNDYDVYDPFFHIEMDELPNSYDETVNNLKWFYGWNEISGRWNYSDLFANFTAYYSRWYEDMDNILDAMFALNDGTNPEDPTNLIVHSQSLNHITLKWDRSYAYDFDSYEILYSTQPIDMGDYQIFSRTQNNLLASQAYEQINVTGLSNSNYYYFKIRARDKNGNYSQLSNEVSSRPAPANVTSMTAFGMNGSVRVYWQVSGQTNNNGFNVYRRTNDSDFALIDSWEINPNLTNSSANSFEWWDNDVVNGEYYTYLISATNTEGIEFYHNYPSTCSPRVIHTITIRNSIGNLNNSISFGNNPNASNGQDVYYDVTTSTPSGSTWVWNAFWQPNWSTNGTHLSREIKAEYDPATSLNTWTMRVRSDQVSQPLTIQVSNTFPRSEKLYLYDGGNGTWHDLLDSDYVYMNTDSNNRTFTIYWGNVQPVVSISSLPNRIYKGGTNATFYWGTQFPFLVDYFDVGVSNGVDSLLIATNLSSNTVSHTLNVPADADIQAAKLFVDVYAVDGIRTRYVSNYTFGLVPSVLMSNNPEGWIMRSNAFTTGNYTISGVFGNDAQALILDYEGEWMYYTPFEFGYGYWVNNPQENALIGVDAIQRDSLSFNLYNGWNLLANPHVCSYGVEDLQFWINGIRYKFGEALSQKLVSKGVYVYRNGIYELTDRIEPHEAFLLKYYGSSSGSTLITFVPYFDGPSISIQPPIWQLTMRAGQDNFDAAFVTIGANPLSTDTYDFRFDLPQPISKPFESVNLYLTRFAEADSAFVERKLKREFREVFDTTNELSKVWDFTLEIPSANPVNFTFDQSLVPENYTITVLIGEGGHHLYNGDTYTFMASEPGVYHGQIIVRNYEVGVSDNVMPPISGMKVYPNPFNPSTNIAFYMGKGDQAQLDIYNVRGQKVKSLYKGFLKAGQQKIEWNGKDDSGRSVASGLYFVRIKTPQSSQTMKMMMMK